jgi:SAM-dependent methyltransferase|tara:strand:+ start:55 stop:738 length:684 start_codon:yes stop_codon:yes gene_type:complete
LELNSLARLRTNVQRFFEKLALAKGLAGCSSILDLGCGDGSPPRFLPPKGVRGVGVDLFEPSLRASLARRIHGDYVRGDATVSCFRDRSFEGVLASHLLEQLSKDKGRVLLDSVSRLATKRVVIMCPNGFLWKNSELGNPHGSNLSSWNPTELRKLGFKVFGLSGAKQLRKGHYVGNHFRYDPKLPFLGDGLIFLTSFFTYFFPRFAFVLFCVKEMDHGTDLRTTEV